MQKSAPVLEEAERKQGGEYVHDKGHKVRQIFSRIRAFYYPIFVHFVSSFENAGKVEREPSSFPLPQAAEGNKKERKNSLDNSLAHSDGRGLG